MKLCCCQKLSISGYAISLPNFFYMTAGKLLYDWGSTSWNVKLCLSSFRLLNPLNRLVSLSRVATCRLHILVFSALFFILEQGSNSKWLAGCMRHILRSRGLHWKNEKMKKKILRQKSMFVKNLAKWLNISFKILIFHDVRRPHWTLSRAACLRPLF